MKRKRASRSVRPVSIEEVERHDLPDYFPVEDPYDHEPVTVTEREGVKPVQSPEEGRLHIPIRAMFCGKTGSGKTRALVTMLKDPQYFKGRFRVIILFSRTMRHDREWADIYIDPEAFIVFDDYDDGIMGRILAEQKEIMEKNPAALEDILVVVDDQGFSTSYRHPASTKMFEEVAYMGRHYGMSAVGLAQ